MYINSQYGSKEEEGLYSKVHNKSKGEKRANTEEQKYLPPDQ